MHHLVEVVFLDNNKIKVHSQILNSKKTIVYLESLFKVMLKLLTPQLTYLLQIFFHKVIPSVLNHLLIKLVLDNILLLKILCSQLNHLLVYLVVILFKRLTFLLNLLLGKLLLVILLVVLEQAKLISLVFHHPILLAHHNQLQPLESYWEDNLLWDTGRTKI